MDKDFPDAIDRNRRLLGLALDCRLIYPKKKEKIEGILQDRLKQDEAVDVIDILKEEKVLTEEKAAYLLALDAHTATCARDRMFGRLAMANQMAAASDIDAALAFQQTRFKQTGESLRLGRILVDRGVITQAGCTALLMTQNRIRNEDLLAAMETLGRSPGEQEMINKRFGVIAIKKDLTTPQQVGQALRCQKQEAAQGKPARFIGLILEEIAGLGREDIDAVLEEQKLMEVRRLDLLHALYPVKAELKVFKRLNRIFSYTISGDGIEAFASKKMVPDAPVPVYEFTIWLKKTGICFGILNDTLLTDFIENAPPDQPVLVARGQEPSAGRDQEIKFYFEDKAPPATPQEPEQEKQEEQENIEDGIPVEGPVTEGDLLAQLIPGQDGRPGRNVLGHPVYPPSPAVRALYPGRGVIRKDNDFLASQDGFPRLKNGTTLVVEALEEPSAATPLTMNLKEDTGDQYLQADLRVKGDILPGAVIKCRSLHLKGNLTGEIRCRGDMTIDGDIGREPGKDIAKKPAEKAPVPPPEEGAGDTGPDNAEPPSSAEVLCHGAIKVSRSVIDADIRCAGTFLAMNATAKGARICAEKGITLKVAVAGPRGPCILRAGLSPKDPLLTIDQTLDAKAGELADLKKEDEITRLTEEFHRDMERAAQHILEKDTYRDLIQIIEGPELYQYRELQDKLDYLYSLPDYSSIKGYFMKIPDTKAASQIVARFLPPANKEPLNEILKQLHKNLDPEPGTSEETSPMPETERIELAFKARLDALEREAEENREAIRQAEREITALKIARQKLGRIYIKNMSPPDFPAIRIKNKCEKGSIIKGVLASLTLKETVYNVRFRETPAAGALPTVIVIEN